MTNKYSDKSIRSKPFETMNPAEKALFVHQAEQAFEKLKATYSGEANMMKALSVLLEKEHERLTPKKNEEKHKEQFARYADNSLNLFGGKN